MYRARPPIRAGKNAADAEGQAFTVAIVEARVHRNGISVMLFFVSALQLRNRAFQDVGFNRARRQSLHFIPREVVCRNGGRL